MFIFFSNAEPYSRKIIIIIIIIIIKDNNNTYPGLLTLLARLLMSTHKGFIACITDVDFSIWLG